jgi:hypothetical protein
MKVKDKIMYQVATDRDYRVGDILHFGTELNGQGKRAIEDSYAEPDFTVRELALEEARKAVNSKLPSRLTCMFLTDSKEAALKGMKEFWTKGRGGTKFQAVAVKLNGELFNGDGNINLLSRYAPEPRPYKSYYDGGLKYWRGEVLKEKNEFLFSGDAEVIEILGEYIHKYK